MYLFLGTFSQDFLEIQLLYLFRNGGTYEVTLSPAKSSCAVLEIVCLQCLDCWKSLGLQVSVLVRLSYAYLVAALLHSVTNCFEMGHLIHVHVQQNIFEKIVIEVHSLHLYASFGTVYVQIGQSFEPQWDFKISEQF